MSCHRLGNKVAALEWFDRSNTWVKEQSELSNEQRLELVGFRSEAAALLGISPPALGP